MSINKTALTQVVPDVHLSTQRPDFDDTLAQEVIRLPLETLLHPRLDVVVLVPYAHFDPVGGIVALTGNKKEYERKCYYTQDTEFLLASWHANYSRKTSAT